MKQIDESNLDKRFTKYYESGERVEVVYEKGYEDFSGYAARNNGLTQRFYVGKSTGWQPIYLVIHRRDSIGGGAIMSKGIISIRGLGTYLR